MIFLLRVLATKDDLLRQILTHLSCIMYSYLQTVQSLFFYEGRKRTYCMIMSSNRFLNEKWNGEYFLKLDKKEYLF